MQNSLATSAALAFPTEISANRPAKGIRVKDAAARNNETIGCAGTPVDFSLLSTDTDGDLSVFISANNQKGNGPPLHVHHKFDEFFCVLDGEFLFQVGGEQRKLLVTVPPASNMESFFWQLSKLLPEKGAPDMMAIQKLYAAHDSEILGPPMGVK